MEISFSSQVVGHECEECQRNAEGSWHSCSIFPAFRALVILVSEGVDAISIHQTIVRITRFFQSRYLKIGVCANHVIIKIKKRESLDWSIQLRGGNIYIMSLSHLEQILE